MSEFECTRSCAARRRQGKEEGWKQRQKRAMQSASKRLHSLPWRHDGQLLKPSDSGPPRSSAFGLCLRLSSLGAMRARQHSATGSTGSVLLVALQSLQGLALSIRQLDMMSDHVEIKRALVGRCLREVCKSNTYIATDFLQ